MVEYDDLEAAFLTARQNKRRSEDNVEFEIHVERNLARLLSDINNRQLAPSAYTFVTMKPRPREVFACDMQMRIIHHYIDIRLRPLIERRLTDRTYNNRIGMGVDAAVNRLIGDIYDVSRGFTRDAWVISIDLSGYFPNANQGVAYEQLTRVALEDYEGPDKDDLLYMIQHAIYSFPAKHCYRKSPMWKWGKYIPDSKSLFRKPDGIGAAIGHLIWQNGMNYYLNDFDHWVLDNLCPHYIRFVDDMYFVVENKDAFLPYLETVRAKLAEVGCTVHPKKFHCQHYTKGVNALGSTIKMDRVYVSVRIVRRAKRSVINFNRCIRVGKIERFLASMNSYLGIFKNKNCYAIIRDLVDMISPKWLKYVHYNDQRKCLQANPGYTHNELLFNKYKFKHGTARKNQCPGVAAA